MLQKTEAIVLNKTKYGDFSFIVNLYSQQFGRFATIIKIPKSKKSELKSNIFSPLNIIDIELDLKSTRSVQTIKYLNKVISLPNISFDIHKTCIAQFIVEIISKTIKEEEPHENLYQFLKETIFILENIEEGTSNLHILFLKEFAKILGFGITNNFCEETPYFNFTDGMFLPVFTYSKNSLETADSRLFSYLLKKTYNDISNIKISYQERLKILEFLLKYYEIHILGVYEIKSLKILNEVFAG